MMTIVLANICVSSPSKIFPKKNYGPIEFQFYDEFILGEMSCWVKHCELELSVMSFIHDFHSSSKLLLLHIPKPAGNKICSCNQTWARPFIISLLLTWYLIPY